MAFADIVTDIPKLADEHDNRHALANEPHAREAVVFMLELPEHGIAGFVYPWINAGGRASAAVCLFGPGLEAPIQERLEEVVVDPAMDFYDWSVGGIEMKIDEPHVSADVRYRGKRVEVDYRFDAIHPVYAFSSHRDGCPQYYADDRTEQHGRARGRIVIDGKEIPFDTFGQRDHSWGARVWGLNQHYKWFHATTERAAVHFFEMQSFGQRLIRGYVSKEGRMAEIRSVDYEYMFDANMHHTHFNTVITDTAGRTTEIKAEAFARFQFEVDEKVLLNESPVTVEVDGVSGIGWCEFCWNRDYLAYAKNYVGKYGPKISGRIFDEG
jgi:hypothetical protein